jgi:hypothetical protein
MGKVGLSSLLGLQPCEYGTMGRLGLSMGAARGRQSLSCVFALLLLGLVTHNTTTMNIRWSRQLEIIETRQATAKRQQKPKTAKKTQRFTDSGADDTD